MFTQMRIRGIGYTLYLVPVPAWRDLEITGAAGCLLVKWQDDGGAQVDEPRCLADAMLLAATMVATEPEYLEQLPGAARESLVQLARVLSGE
jgi:hypothetical protein